MVRFELRVKKEGRRKKRLVTKWCIGGRGVAPWGTGWSRRTWLGGGECPWRGCWGGWRGRREWWATPGTLLRRKGPKARGGEGPGAWRVCRRWWTWCSFGKGCSSKWSGKRGPERRKPPRSGLCRNTGPGWTSCTISRNRMPPALRSTAAPWRTSPCTNLLRWSSSERIMAWFVI